MKYIITLIFILIQSVAAIASDKLIASSQCAESFSKNKLLGGWYLWNPYQFNKVTPSGYNLTGMDIDLVKSISKRVGVEITYEQVDWKKHQEDLRSGERDIAAGSTYTTNRAEYVYFSIPYRFEENSLFTLTDSNKNLEFKSISEFLAQIRLQNYILGVTEGFIYADPQINLFINDQTTQDIIKRYTNDIDALNALMKGEIDGFIADRVVGASAILSNGLVYFRSCLNKNSMV